MLFFPVRSPFVHITHPSYGTIALLALHRPPPSALRPRWPTQRCLCHLPKSSFCSLPNLYFFQVPSHQLLVPYQLRFREANVSLSLDPVISTFVRRRSPSSSFILGVLRAMITRMPGLDFYHFMLLNFE